MSCYVTTAGNVIIGSNVTVVFGTGITAVGTIVGPGPAALAGLGAQPLLPPPPPPGLILPPPPPLLPPPPGMLPPPGDLLAGGMAMPPSSIGLPPGYASIPVVPEADSAVLLAGGLLAIGAFAAQRGWRRRRDV